MPRQFRDWQSSLVHSASMMPYLAKIGICIADSCRLERVADLGAADFLRHVENFLGTGSGSGVTAIGAGLAKELDRKERSLFGFSVLRKSLSVLSGEALGQRVQPR